MQTVLDERFTVRLTKGARALLEVASEQTHEAPSEFARRVIVAATVGVLTGPETEPTR